MTIDGRWKLNITSPLGPMESELDVTSSGDTLTGVQRGQGDEGPIQNGKVKGDAVAWSVEIKKPISTTLTFNGTVSGDRLEGKVKAGMFGSFPFEGARA